MEIAGSQTAENLKTAFAAESLAASRYLYFAQKAETEGHDSIARAFRATAETCLSQAHGHLEYLQSTGDPVTGEVLGTTDKNLAAALAEQRDAESIDYAAFAANAQADGFAELKDWFKRLDESRKQHLRTFTQALDELGEEEQEDGEG